jgi:hypothetical protein
VKRLVSACIVIAAGLAACLVVAPHFSSTYQQVVVVSQDPVLFGNVPVGTTSMPQPVTLSPPGTTAVMDQVNAITPMCSDFAVQAPGLPAPVSRVCMGSGGGSTTFDATSGCTDTTYTFTGTFSPAVAGTSSCAVLLDLMSGMQTITFTGSGSAPMFLIDVQPPSINFGDVPINTPSSPATMTIRNAGSAPLTINSVAVTVNPMNTTYAIPSGNVGMHTIAIAGQENYTITCTPPMLGSVDGMITITSNDSMHSPLNVPLKCSGINSDLSIAPSPATFASARVGEPPLDITVDIHYTGATSRTITGINLDGTSVADLTVNGKPALPVTLTGGSGDAGGADTTFKLHYAATMPHAMGPIGGVVVQATGLTDQTVIVNGAALATSMSLTPAVLDLGPVCVGAMAHADVDVFANNAGSFMLQSVTGIATPFSLTSFSPGLVPSGMHKTFTINVNPTAPGALSQTASVNTDIPGMATHDLMVTAQALPAGVTPTPDVVQFGTWMLGVASSLRKVQLTNCGAGPLTIQSASIDGTPEFQIVNDPPIMNAMVDPGMSFEIDLLMVPTSVGAKTAHLVLATDAGQQLVELDGAGTGGTDNGGKDRESYYACGTGRAIGFAPLALALLLLRRRRR